MHIIAQRACQPSTRTPTARSSGAAYRLKAVVLTSDRPARRGEHQRVNKKRRHQVILELVAAQPVATQAELRQLLDDRGFAVTQSTLSRDLRELRLARS